MPDTKKPLPALPQKPNLSIDARTHRARLIRHLLAEVPDPAILARLDGWACAIEEALDELSRCLASGGWLKGVRRRRESVNHARLRATLRTDKDKETNSQGPATPSPVETGYSKINESLKQLRAQIVQSTGSSAENASSHLVLCLAPCGVRVQPSADDHVSTSASIGCSFAPSRFLLPREDTESLETSVLYGLHEWDQTIIPPPRIIGGTFSFHGLNTPSQHPLLVRLLRISIYIHLSLLLETAFLADSHVHLKYPRPKLTFPSPSAPDEGTLKPSTSAPAGISNSSGDHSPRSPLIPPGILSFFSRKRQNASLAMGGRAQTLNPQSGQSSTLDLVSNSVSPTPLTSSTAETVTAMPPKSPRTSVESSQGASRLGRLVNAASGAGSGHERRPSLRHILYPHRDTSTPIPPPSKNTGTLSSSEHPGTAPTAGTSVPLQGPFAHALANITSSRTYLSTSPGISFPPPQLIIDLADKEARKPYRRLKGDEKAALGSILGWASSNGSSSMGVGIIERRGGTGMWGVGGFLRHQEVSVLVSRYVPGAEMVLEGQGVGIGTTNLMTPDDARSITSTSPQVVPITASTGVANSTTSSALSAASTTASTIDTTNTTSSTLTTATALPTPAHLLPASSPLPSSTKTATAPAPATTTSNLTQCNIYGRTPNRTLACGRPQYQTYTYFSGKKEEDVRLGEMILEMILCAGLPCSSSASGVGGVGNGGGRCGFKCGEHEVRYVHNGLRVSCNVRGGEGWNSRKALLEDEGQELKDKKYDIEMWQSCKICKKKSEVKVMSDATFLLSYAKFLELLVYSPNAYNLSPALCEHTTPGPPPIIETHTENHVEGIPDSRTNIIRHFGLKIHPPHSKKTPAIDSPATTTSNNSGTSDSGNENNTATTNGSNIAGPGPPVVTFSISRVENIFELRVPRLQINGGQELEKEREELRVKQLERAVNDSGGTGGVEGEEKKKVLRREIKKWWEGVGDHLDKLERILVVISSASTSGPTALERNKNFKRLPRLPSMDDAYTDFSDDSSSISSSHHEDKWEDDVSSTPRPNRHKELPPEGSKPPPNTPVTKFPGFGLGIDTGRGGSEGGGEGRGRGGEEEEEDDDLVKTPTVQSRTNVSTSGGGTNEGEMEGESGSSVITTTITTSPIDIDSGSTMTTTSNISSSTNSESSSPPATTSTISAATTIPSDPFDLLSNLRQSLQRTEHSLYAQLVRTPDTSLNDVRRVFLSSARGAQKRLSAWQKKHLGSGRIWKDGVPAQEWVGLMREFGLLPPDDSVGVNVNGQEKEKDGEKGKPKEAVKEKDAWKAVKAHVENVKCEEPEWWNAECHAVPGSSIIVREDDWGSIIAFTLSSQDYHRELANISVTRTAPSTPPILPSPPPTAPSRHSSTSTTTSTATTSSAAPSIITSGPSFFTTTTGKIFGSSATQPDPDRDDITWHELETCSAVISRKEHPRDPTSILSIREVLRHKSPAISDITTHPSSSGVASPIPGMQGGSSVGKSGMAGSSQHGTTEGGQSHVSLAVYAKPDVGVSMAAVGGEFGGSSGIGKGSTGGVRVAAIPGATTESTGRALHELEAVVAASAGMNPSTAVSGGDNANTSREGGEYKVEPSTGEVKVAPTDLTIAHIPVPLPLSPELTSSVAQAHEQVNRVKGSSVLSLENELAKAMDGCGVLKNPPVPPPKDKEKEKQPETEKPWKEQDEKVTTQNMKELPATPSGSTIHQPTPSQSSFAGTIASSLNMAMRFVLNHSDPKSPSLPPPVPKKPHHNLLLVDLNNIDDRPHIKYDWTIGKRLKFSCTVYYAKQFELMRKRCGVDDTYLRSLERSLNWAAVGGKSRSDFWKTTDEKFIIKTLVNAWNVADLQFLIELGPSYFKYIESTASRATVLAKLVGFYTIEIRNLETGNVQSKADLLVMENLFYNRKIDKTFDLKGIQGRKVKTKQSGTQKSKTLFDGEWIEGQQRTLILLKPHSKSILREALRSDADFLARSNIMDYSLLLGIDEQKKQIACGLVDTIGSYTFAKTLEYKAKQNLHGKDVTVIPPAEYQERFVNALENYFLACPDKWSKPMDESRIVSDPFLLPSVL